MQMPPPLNLTGYTLEEVLGQSVLTFADNQEEAARLLAEFLEKGSWVGEVAGRKKDGSRIVTPPVGKSCPG